MKVSTLGVLTATSMFLSSVTVWSLTEPSSRLKQDTPSVISDLGISDDEPGGAIQLANVGAEFETGRTLRLQGRLGHAVVEANKAQETFALFTVRADSQADTRAAAPLNVAILLDRSGSMRGQPLLNALAAARTMVERLREGDTITLVAYDTQASVVVPPTAIDPSSRTRVLSAISQVQAGGDTCISCALTTGAEIIAGRTGISRVLLLSDGEPTVGLKDIEALRGLAQNAERSGLTITTIGVDVDYNERLMTAIASGANGRHYFAEHAAQLPSIFDQELQGLEKSVAQQAAIAFELEPGVELEQVFDRQFTREGKTIRVKLGDFSAGEEKTVLMRLRTPERSTGRLAMVRAELDYHDVLSGTPGDCRGSLAALVSDEPSSLDALVRVRLQRSETASTLTEANRLFASGRVDEAKKKLTRSITELQTSKPLALEAAPAAKARDVSSDFERQEAALNSAFEGFAVPPPAATGAAAAPARRAAKAQVRKNEADAFRLGF